MFRDATVATIKIVSIEIRASGPWEDTGDRYDGSGALALLHDCAARDPRGAASINQGEFK
ncbi:hypothetical protein EB232_33730 [Mesorhizobium sp. NZP2077]|nr:hypothetical protein EB232_33730 [Mesorhizobium sp. NZP2077]